MRIKAYTVLLGLCLCLCLMLTSCGKANPITVPSADDDIENKRLLDEVESRKYYWYAIGCLGIATVSAVASYFVKIPYLNILSILGVVGYVIFGILSKPKYKRLSAKKMIVPYIFPA